MDIIVMPQLKHRNSNSHAQPSNHHSTSFTRSATFHNHLASAMTPPTFATPLPQSPHSSILEWRFPRPYQHLVLTGRSRAAWHTSFVIPQLDLLLDAGLCVNKLRPKHIFLTHGHSDHTLLTPAFTHREDPPDIFCPVEMKDALDAFLHANTWLNEGGGARPPEGPASDGEGEGEGEGDGVGDEVRKKRKKGKGKEEQSPPPPPPPPPPSQPPTDEAPTETAAANVNNNDNPPRPHPAFPHLFATHTTHGLLPGAAAPLRRLAGPPTWSATAFRCDHTVPCLGYVFSATTPKLRPELRGLPPAELRALRRRDPASLTVPVATPVFAFLGDTTASVLAAGPEWLGEPPPSPPPLLSSGKDGEAGKQGNDTERGGGGGGGGGGVKVVITECSFLYPEHRAQAAKTKHTCWAELEPVVRRWWKTVFVLCHFSLRYSEEEIRQFFAEREGLGNVVVWIGDKT
ncbi:hypothetical protein VTJ83DRAFT_860 [Remersonia thermophila]|uniref:Metallo-beta-lactamase domain-containing protein n=1 Tax=Remersonia thermophila TaxID=72144 RepID=A0ABR4DN14_9PEZI